MGEYSRKIRKATALLACLLARPALAPPFGGDALGRCVDSFEMLVLQETEGYRDLSGDQIAFLIDHLAPVAGKRLCFDPAGSPRQCRVAPDSVEFSGYEGGKSLRVEWVEGLDSPYVDSTATHRVLYLPKGYDLKKLPDNGQSLVLDLLMGHPLHPYSGSKRGPDERVRVGEPAFLHKQAQQDGVDAAIATMKAGHRSFLYVAPTGTGKTKVLTDILDYRLAQGGRKLTVLVADSNPLVKQLEGDVRGLAETVKSRNGGTDEPFEIIRWGDDQDPMSIPDLMAKVAASKKPVILVTTIQSFKKRMSTGDEQANLKDMRKNLNTFAYDEAHHTGAPEAQELVRSLIWHPESDAFLYGTTATPTHRLVHIQHDLFENRAFWAYLDDPKEFATRTDPRPRDVGDVERQLRAAIKAGELTPFDGIFFIDRNRLTLQGKSFYETTAGNSYRISEDHRPVVAKAIQPLLRSHKKGFIAVPSVEDAIKLKEILNAMTPGKRFEVLYNDMPGKAKVLERFKAPDSDIDFLITVRMFDEGINHPDLSLYIDLNRSVGARQRLQRMGRVLRLADGKESVQMAMLRDPFDFDNLADDLRFVDAVAAGKYSGPRAKAKKGRELPDLDSDTLIRIDDEEHSDQAKRVRQEMHRVYERESRDPQEEATKVNEYWRRRTGKSDGSGDLDGMLDLPSSDARAYPDEAKLRAAINKYKRNPYFLAALDVGPRQRIIKHDLEGQVRQVRGDAIKAAVLINKYVDSILALPRLSRRSEKKIAEVLRDFKDDRDFQKAISDDVKELLQTWTESD